MDNEFKDLDEELELAMGYLIQIMRHLLGNIHEEHDALLRGSHEAAANALLKRSLILEEVSLRQQKMADVLRGYGETCASLEDLAAVVGEDKITLLALRDQIAALAARIESDNRGTVLALAAQTAPVSKKQGLALLD